ncbi:EpsG family protein [uncultured Bacteroides sp.]|uniref:EpsG family protein n=1 Tax=uncultured Bacteroides sp. TaxID=162156 RepID=UPI0025922D17|nr:EpsG family protein [uncultured Bacteroides sp.]
MIIEKSTLTGIIRHNCFIPWDYDIDGGYSSFSPLQSQRCFSLEENLNNETTDIIEIMEIYFFLLLVGIIGALLSQDCRLKNIGFYFISICILLLFAMVVFRYDVGADYLSYKDYYNRIHSVSKLTAEDFFVEPGYVILSSLLRSIGAPFEILSLILFSIIVYNLKRTIFYFSDNVPLSIVLYIFLFFLSFNFNLVRHGVMVTFVWKGCFLWLENEKKKAVFSLVVGAMFHVLSLFFLPILLISSKKYPTYMYVCILVLSFFVALHPDTVISLFDALLFPMIGMDNRLFFYLNGGHSGELNETSLTMGMFFNIAIFGASYLLFSVRKKIFLYNILFVGIVFFLLFNSFGAISQRIASTCYMANIFIIPSIVNLVHVNRWRFLCMAIVLLYGILMFSQEIFKDSGNYIPFTTIF